MQQVVSLTLQELRVATVLASIFSLRMLGLCMLLPVFALEAHKFPHSTPQLIGVAIGAYGLVQAVLQIPFGVLSDKYGRKPLILCGLVLLLIGSLITAQATSIYGLILGRVLQGSCAIGSVVIATLADHTRSQIRMRAMAILGISIGLAFMCSMVLGPWINKLVGFRAIFSVTAGLTVVAITLLLIAIPKTAASRESVDMGCSVEREIVGLGNKRILFNLHFGVFVLHTSLAALFLVLPLIIQQAGFAGDHLWQLYLGVLVIALMLSLRMITQAEKRQQIDKLQIVAIVGLLVAEIWFCLLGGRESVIISLLIFFTAFCILEASLPTLVSKTAASNKRGAALGLYSSLQFLGIFFGGIMGGWLHSKFGVVAVIGLCLVLAATWLSMAILWRDKVLHLNKTQGLNYG